MRARKIMTVVGATIGVAALIVVFSVPWRCPVTVSLAGIEPSGTFDAAGKELSVVYVRVGNRGTVPLAFDPTRVEGEAKIGNRWFAMPAPAPGPAGWIPYELLVLAPPNADAIRFRFWYDRQSRGLEFEVLNWAWRSFPWLYGNHFIGRYLTSLWAGNQSKPHSGPRHWQLAQTPAVQLPPNLPRNGPDPVPER